MAYSVISDEKNTIILKIFIFDNERKTPGFLCNDIIFPNSTDLSSFAAVPPVGETCELKNEEVKCFQVPSCGRMKQIQAKSAQRRDDENRH